MNVDQIYGRIKRLRKMPYKRIASGHKLFDIQPPNSNSYTEYDPNHLLDEDEWHAIFEFSRKPYCLDIIKTGLNSVDTDEISKDQFDNISYLISTQSDSYLFQRVRPSSLLQRKIVAFGDQATVEAPTRRIVINPTPDAIYISPDDVLLFRDLSAISPIFTGVDALYKEATDEQVSHFLDFDFISCSLDVSKISKPNRKRIALALGTLEQMQKSERDSVVHYIHEYTSEKLPFDSESKVFKVGDDYELKILVYGIEQRFYTTPIGAEKRQANSISRI